MELLTPAGHVPGALYFAQSSDLELHKHVIKKRRRCHRHASDMVFFSPPLPLFITKVWTLQYSIRINYKKYTFTDREYEEIKVD